jgi:hypothetical protein
MTPPIVPNIIPIFSDVQNCSEAVLVFLVAGAAVLFDPVPAASFGSINGSRIRLNHGIVSIKLTATHIKSRAWVSSPSSV